MFRTRTRTETASRPTARRGSVGSAAVWDAERRAGHGKETMGPVATAASRCAPGELASLVSGIVQVTLDTRLADSTPTRRAELARELEERLLVLLGVAPRVPARDEQRSASPAVLETPVPPNPPFELPGPRPETRATSPASRALELVLEERLTRLGGAVAARSDLRQRLIELAVSVSVPESDASASHEELRRLDVLQRRAAKVEQSLHEARAALAYVSGLEHVDTGVASIYRTVQGLSAADPARACKQGVLEAVFRANLRLQKARTDP